jgi:hypothetical protein
MPAVSLLRRRRSLAPPLQQRPVDPAPSQASALAERFWRHAPALRRWRRQSQAVWTPCWRWLPPPTSKHFSRMSWRGRGDSPQAAGEPFVLGSPRRAQTRAPPEAKRAREHQHGRGLLGASAGCAQERAAATLRAMRRRHCRCFRLPRPRQAAERRAERLARWRPFPPRRRPPPRRLAAWGWAWGGEGGRRGGGSGTGSRAGPGHGGWSDSPRGAPCGSGEGPARS